MAETVVFTSRRAQRRVRAAWCDVATADADGTRVTVTLADGRVHRLDFADAPEADHVIASLSAAAARELAAREPPAGDNAAPPAVLKGPDA